MLIWTGWGIVVPVVLFMSYLFPSLLQNELALIGPDMTKPFIIGLLIISAGVLYKFGTYLEEKPGHMVIDKASGQEIELKSKHSFFFIPIKYWTFVTLFFAVATFFGIDLTEKTGLDPDAVTPITLEQSVEQSGTDTPMITVGPEDVQEIQPQPQTESPLQPAVPDAVQPLQP